MFGGLESGEFFGVRLGLLSLAVRDVDVFFFSNLFVWRGYPYRSLLR